MLEITSKAAQEFKQILKGKGNEGKTIRIFSIGGGCCGPSVGMDVVAAAQLEDETIEQDGLVVYLEQKASLALDGVTIDFSGYGPQKGFMIRNAVVAAVLRECRASNREIRYENPRL